MVFKDLDEALSVMTEQKAKLEADLKSVNNNILTLILSYIAIFIGSLNIMQSVYLPWYIEDLYEGCLVLLAISIAFHVRKLNNARKGYKQLLFLNSCFLSSLQMVRDKNLAPSVKSGVEPEDLIKEEEI